MSAGTRKFDLGSLNRKQRNEPPMPARPRDRDAVGTDQLRIVRFDEPEFLNGSKLDNAAKMSRAPHRPLADFLAKDHAAEEAAKTPDSPREPGVDLTALHPQEIDTRRLASFVNDTPPKSGKNAPSAPTGKDIVMPLANTNLQDILQADKICMVARPHHNAPTLEGVGEPLPEPVPAVTPTLPAQKTPHFLDKTQQYLVQNWPKLPSNVQAAILNVIDAAVSPDEE
jgi:hypothetical protein